LHQVQSEVLSIITDLQLDRENIPSQIKAHSLLKSPFEIVLQLVMSAFTLINTTVMDAQSEIKYREVQ
jgi:hypothetical protein